MKKKVSFKEWSVAIREARSFIRNYDKNRWKVAEIALRVCDTSHGGRKGNQFSIKKFADEIELNHKTLYEWIKAKTLLIDRLPTKLQKEALNKRGFNDLRIISYKIKEDYTPTEVKSVYMEYFGQKPENMKFIKYKRFLASLMFNSQRPVQMMEVDSEIIHEMISILETILGGFKKELELREKYSTKDRITKNTKVINDAINEANELKL